MSPRPLRVPRILAAAVLAAGLAGPASAQQTLEYAERSSPGVWNQIVDVAIVRPLGLAPILMAPAACSAWLVLSAPVSWLRGESIPAVQICFVDPVEYTFRRPLDEF